MTRPAWSWRHAILQAEIPATTKHVLLTISCFMNDLGEGCYRSTKDLARFSGLSERAVCTHIENAVALGWLARAQHGFRGQRWKRHEYEPRWPRKGADPGSAPPEKALNDVREGTEPHAKKALNPVPRDKTLSPICSPSSPSEEIGPGEEFSKFWTSWPASDRPKARALARKLFGELTAADQANASAFAARYRRLEARRGGFAAMIPYLRARLFLEFINAPPVDQDDLFRITPDREEWGPWLADFRLRFRPESVAKQEALGFILATTRWPPGFGQTPLSSVGFARESRPSPQNVGEEGEGRHTGRDGSFIGEARG